MVTASTTGVFCFKPFSKKIFFNFSKAIKPFFQTKHMCSNLHLNQEIEPQGSTLALLSVLEFFSFIETQLIVR